MLCFWRWLEQAADQTEPFVRGRGEAKFVRHLPIAIDRLDIQIGVHQIVGIVVEICT